MDLSGRTVFITGASSGIGAACARAFASQGSRLLLAARRVERIEAAIPDLKKRGAPEVRAERLDVRDAAAVMTLVSSLAGAWKEIEVLVDNAGLSRGLDKLQDGSLDDWNEMLDTNVKGVLHVDRAVVPLMVARGRGTVIHLGSIAGRQTTRGATCTAPASTRCAP
jgi:NADP-dependent 3-hydroxy acid dehydrogenase YdfG